MSGAVVRRQGQGLEGALPRVKNKIWVACNALA